jgi:hypothetical protein
MRAKRFWIRTLFASLISQGILVTVAYTITFFFDYEFKKIAVLILTAWLVKLPFILILIYPTTLLAKLTKKRENLEHFDYNISYNPFGFSIDDRMERKNASR